ncbi:MULTISPECIES: hypothetical protein [Bradyrhizobium]|uniref:Uncharacterized protein n=1 Tax=Bradyrhizobium arachidis TaxID=858423 RepID=A0AAE7NHL1_9BRAD|nr:hypothetical protein [Bradyrhizobium arachidis]QOZ66343.1 hypothetical protein WN72_07910 [Bradyrhizobium arachidis]
MIRIEMDAGVAGRIDRIGKAINKGLAFTLTDSAKFANEDLLTELRGKVDRPSPYTLNKSGYGLTIAKIDDVSPFSESFVKPDQAAYLKFIMGMASVRGLGDAGASARHAWVPGQRPGFTPSGSYSAKPRLSTYGGVPDKYSKALYDLSKKDFAMTLRTPGKTTGLAPSSQGGVFYVRKPSGKLKVGAFYARAEAHRADHRRTAGTRREEERSFAGAASARRTWSVHR